MDKLVLYSQERSSVLSKLPTKTKYAPIDFEKLGKKRKRKNECWLCDDINEIHDQFYKLFRNEYNLNSNDEAIFDSMTEMYSHFLAEVEDDEKHLFPKMTSADFKSHFLQHLIDGHVELSQQLKKLRVLESILLNSCVLKDNKSQKLKVDDGCLKNILIIQNQIRSIYQCDPSKFCFKNTKLKFD
jgi:hypothetical protein